MSYGFEHIRTQVAHSPNMSLIRSLDLKFNNLTG